uniref:DUF295 domain-containing protein n=1 Tax=Oryza glumipatula TaxID=40148 RepID=A0A0E0B720_9ORYZ
MAPPAYRNTNARKQLKRKRCNAGTDEHDGCPLHDEVLLLVMSLLVPDIADLVSLALGFFFTSTGAGTITTPDHNNYMPLRFVPLRPSSSPRRRRRRVMLADLVDGDGLPILQDSSSRVVASRNGRLVVEIRRTKSLILKLCVCNPITGEVDVLPHLRGSDRPPRLYECALLTVDDLQYFNLGNDEDDHYTTSPSSYRVVLMYNRRGGSRPAADSGGRRCVRRARGPAG